jgi:ubiquitin carboxyl-terminal hydrolase 34
MPSSVPDTIRNRSNSEEDAELPTHDRKRARLSESGDRDSVLPRLTASTPPQTADASALSTTEPAIAESLAKPPLPPRIAETMATPSPTSKVTINTRPLSSQSITIDDASPTTESAIAHLEEERPSSLENGGTEEDPDVAVSETLTVARSPSPPIEAAEPEDYDQDPAETRWTTHFGATVTAIQPIQPYHVYQTFPHAADFSPGQSRLAVQYISKVFADARKDDVDIFRQVKDWLTDFTNRCGMMTQEIIDEDPAFWRQVPFLLDRLCLRDQRTPSPIGFQDMNDFFIAYGHLCRLFLDYDAARLVSFQSASSDADISLFSTTYLQPFHRIVDWQMTPANERYPFFFDSLRRHHNLDLSILLKPVAEALARPLLLSLGKYIKALGPVLLKVPAAHKDLLNSSAFLAVATQSVCPVFFTPEHCLFGHGHPLEDEVRALAESAAVMMEEILQLGIKKQHAWLSCENKAPAIIDYLNASMGALAGAIPRLGKSVIHAADMTYSDADLTDLAATMRYAWRFMICLKLIKHGRMELRVHGMQKLCSELINIYNFSVSPYRAGSNEPIVRFTIRFLRENNVINYLVGPDSHPQLISRAGNVLGFFGVSGNYDDADTDSIWQVIIDSSDARGAAEFWSMMRDALPTMGPRHLYYICGKLCDLPYSRWNGDILSFTDNLLSDILSHKLNPNPGYWQQPVQADPVVRRLALKLLKDSLQPMVCDSDLSVKVRETFVRSWLAYFKGINDDPSKLSMSPAEETQMLWEIRTDIESHDSSASGSIFAVLHIISCVHLNATGMHTVIEMCGLPRSLVDDLADISKSRTSQQAPQQPSVLFDIRLECLAFLMAQVPEQFDLECLESFWTSVLVSTQIDQKVRDRAWNSITNLVGKYRVHESAVVEKILQHFWPRLRPVDMNQAVLDLAKAGVAYETAFTRVPDMEGQDVVQIPGLDRVKQIMLDAEPGTVEAAAGEYMIDQYLRNPVLSQRSKTVVHATHLNLIDDWVAAVLASATQLKSLAESEDSMTTVASEQEIVREERHFDRSLLFLRRFTEAIKGNPGCSPLSPRQQAALPEFPSIKGATRDLVIEIGSSKYVDKGEKRVSLGADNTGSELWEYLATITGFSSFRVFHGGQSIALQEEQKTIGDLQIMAKVQVQKTPEATETTPRKRLRSTSPVDEKIMLHFDDLYGLLEADDRLAKEIYTFLTITSVRKEVSHKIREMETPASLVLPCEKPYKLLFCVQALRACIEEESFSTNPDLVFVRYAIEALSVAFTKLASSGFNSTLQLRLAFELLDSLLLAFRTKVPHGTGRDYISDHAKFVQNVVDYSLRVQQVGGASLQAQSPEKPIRVGVETLIEGRLHDGRMWDDLASNEALSKLLRNTLIASTDEKVRQAVVEVVTGLTGQAGLKNLPKANDPRAARSRHDSATIESCLLRLWNLLTQLLPVAETLSLQCQQFFDTTLGILRRIGKVLDVEALNDLLPLWSDSLLAHCHFEIVGQPLQDRFVGGAAPVIQEIARLLRNSNSLPKQTNLLQGIIIKYLRPPLSATGTPAEPLPILDTGVRESLYNLLLTLSTDAADLDMLVMEFGEEFDISDHLPGRLLNDRLALRSEVGYGGLRNLSNTCYLNSLLTQLFMNVRFRELILKYGAENKNRQLVSELSKVFSWMQGCFEKSIDPSATVESITQWSGEQIDVTVQMDVDEFFNLLFDRLENQIADPSVRAQMKSLYGGETIQQIKSKECEHISERPESFSVLPVEIKGKASLQDSLQAYIAGEVLQGDNKYSCTSCGKHVDAVKRSCLKHVPDNLIFNLKRFDFDLVNFVRAKLNDSFDFPEALDMAPYQLDSLNGSTETPTADIFELTGIIVHSGTAETGHYYSYIRQRPSSDGLRGSWVEFNDADVSNFDPSRIADCCFGGPDPSLYGMARYYSAYMLFYERRSSIEETAKRFAAVEPGNPLRLDIAPDLKEIMDQANEMFVRAYCMQDPVHARFIRDLLRAVGDIDNGVCSRSHDLETAALTMALDYMHKVSSRWKSLPDLEATANIIKTLVGRCKLCAWQTFHWFSQNELTVVECVVDSPYNVARKAFCSILIDSLQVLHKAVNEQDATLSEKSQYIGTLDRIIHSLQQSFLVVTRTPRCWPEYFPLITQISSIGPSAQKLVVEHGFVGLCFEIIYIHQLEDAYEHLDKLLRVRYSGYVNLREKHRPYQHVFLMQCFAHLLSKVKLDIGWEEDADYDEDVPYLSDKELDNMGFQHRPASFTWVQRLISGRQAPETACQVVKIIASYRIFASDLGKALLAGVNYADMTSATTFIEPLIAFCEHCASETLVVDYVKQALHGIDTIGTDYAPEFLRMVIGFLKIRGQFEDDSQEVSRLFSVVETRVARWAPVMLYGLNDSTSYVRHEALQLVNALLFIPLNEAQSTDPVRFTQLRDRAKDLGSRLSRYGRSSFLSHNPRDNQTMQAGHFNEALEVMQRCIDVAFSDIATANEEHELAHIQETMAQLRSKPESVVELISSNDFEGSSDLEALSDMDGEDFHSSPT